MYVGDVATRADLDRFTGVTPGAVFRIIDEDVWVMLAPAGAPPPDGDTTTTTTTAGTAGQWQQVAPAAAVQPYALVNGHWPYVQGPDMVVAYPEVSRDLANKLNVFAQDWHAYRDGRPWPSWNGTVVQFPADGVMLSMPGTDAGALWIRPGNPAQWLWYHNGAWRELANITWETIGTPNGPKIHSYNGTRWHLFHPENMFSGVFLSAARLARTDPAAAVLVPARTVGDPAGTDDGTAGQWDLAATVEKLAGLVVSLQDRIAVLEGKP